MIFPDPFGQTASAALFCNPEKYVTQSQNSFLKATKELAKSNHSIKNGANRLPLRQIFLSKFRFLWF